MYYITLLNVSTKDMGKDPVFNFLELHTNYITLKFFQILKKILIDTILNFVLHEYDFIRKSYMNLSFLIITRYPGTTLQSSASLSTTSTTSNATRHWQVEVT